jgi:hypothetical protein
VVTDVDAPSVVSTGDADGTLSNCNKNNLHAEYSVASNARDRAHVPASHITKQKPIAALVNLACACDRTLTDQRWCDCAIVVVACTFIELFPTAYPHFDGS